MSRADTWQTQYGSSGRETRRSPEALGNNRIIWSDLLPLHVIPGEGPVSDAPQESLSLNFAKVNWKYSVLDAKTSEKPEVVGRDLTQQKKM
jgi:hypothetical protein